MVAYGLKMTPIKTQGEGGGGGQTEAHHPPVAGKQRIKPGLHSYDIFPNLQQGNR